MFDNGTLKGMNVTVDKKQLLIILKNNKDKHAKIVKEARAGYVKEAEAALRNKLEKLIENAKKGKIVALAFNLSPPQDYTSIYNEVIAMLEMHMHDSIELNAMQHRNLVMDKWDWTDQFLFANSTYSQTARRIAE